MDKTYNNTPLSNLFYSQMNDEYHAVLPGKDFDSLPSDAEFVEAVRHEALLVYCVDAYNMIVMGAFVQPPPLLQ